MNTKAIYEKATTPPEVLEQRKAEQEKKSEATHFAAGVETQNYQQWLQHSVTQSLIKYLEAHVDAILSKIMLQSCSMVDSEERIHMVKGAAMAKIFKDMIDSIKNQNITKVN